MNKKLIFAGVIDLVILIWSIAFTVLKLNNKIDIDWVVGYAPLFISLIFDIIGFIAGVVKHIQSEIRWKKYLKYLEEHKEEFELDDEYEVEEENE